MPTGRMLNKKISFDEKLAQISLESLLVFTWTIPHLDVEGRILGDPNYIKAQIFPLIDQVSVRKIKKALKELEEKNLILIYGHKIKYIQFNGFLKNQRINKEREAKSTIPPPTELLSNSGVTQDTSLKLSTSTSKVKVKEDQPSNGQHLNSQLLNIELPLLTEKTEYEPKDFYDSKLVTESVKKLVTSFLGLENPEQRVITSFVNIIMKTKQVNNKTAFSYLFDTFLEFHTYPDEKRNLAYLYKRLEGRINDALIKGREEKAKREKQNEKSETSLNVNDDISQLASKMKFN